MNFNYKINKCKYTRFYYKILKPEKMKNIYEKNWDYEWFDIKRIYFLLMKICEIFVTKIFEFFK